MGAKSEGAVDIDVNLNIDQAEKELNKILRTIAKLKADIARREGAINPLAEQLLAAKDEAVEAYDAVERLKEELADIKAITSGAAEADPEEYLDAVMQQKAIEEELRAQEKTERQKAKIAERLQAQYDKQLATLEQQRKTLADQESAALAAQKKQAKAQARDTVRPINKAVQGAEKTISRLTRTISNSLRRVFFFSLFYAGLRQIRDGLMQVVKTNENAVTAIARLKGAFLTLAQPIVNALVPAFIAMANAASTAVEMFAELTAYLFGTTAQESAKAAKALYDEANGLEEVKDAAEEAEGSLASFDQINTIDTEPKQDKSQEDDAIRPDFAAFDTNRFKTAFDRFRAMLATGIALLTIGAILTFTGVNIPLGIGMMAAGAAMICAAVALNWNSMDGPLKQEMAVLMKIIGLSMAVVGVILLLMGQIPLGLALVVAGAFIFGAGVMAANWNAIDGTLNERLGEIAKTVGVFLAVVGVILLLTGNIPLGIGLIVAGIALFKAGEIAMEWDSLGDTLEDRLWAVVETIANYMIVFGIILLFIPSQQPLGVGMIVAGASILAAKEIALNWDSLGDTIEEKILGILDILKDYMLIVGLILLFVPNFQLLGVGLITAGIAVLAAKEVALNWDSMGDTIEEKLAGILDVVKYYMMILGFILLFVPGFRPLGFGLLTAGIGILAAQALSDSYALDEDMKGKLTVLLDVISSFMIVLGVILLFTGVLTPVAIGLIGAGVGILGAGVIAPNWNYLLNFFRGLWTKIGNWWRTGPSKYFTMNYWKDKAADMINGLVNGIRSGISSVGSAIASLFSGSNTDISVSTSPAAVTRSAASTASAYPASIRAADVPALARGAVIPANREFLAVLGDQKNGRNLEAPEALLRQIAQEGNAEIVTLLTQLLAAVKGRKTIYLDGKKIADNTVRHINDRIDASGTIPLHL